MKKRIGLLALPLFLLASCDNFPSVVSPSKEAELAAGSYWFYSDHDVTLTLNADFSCVFHYVTSNGNQMDEKTTYSLRQLAADEDYGFGMMHPPLEGTRVYEFSFADTTIGNVAANSWVKGIGSVKKYLTHYYPEKHNQSWLASDVYIEIASSSTVPGAGESQKVWQPYLVPVSA